MMTKRRLKKDDARLLYGLLIAMGLACSSLAAPPETASSGDSTAKAESAKAGAGSARPTRLHAANHRRATASSTPGAPKKIVVRQGGVEEPTAEIVTGMTPEEADRQRHEAELFLRTTDEKLKEIAARQFDSQQEETISQIRDYMEGSRSALKQGDVTRAHTLALKAGLLADDLGSH